MKIKLDGRYYMPYDYEDEIWYSVKGYSLYQVSNYCRVKNIQTGNILHPQRVNTKRSHTLHFRLYNGGRHYTLAIKTLQKEHRWEFIAKIDFSDYLHYRRNEEYIYGAF